MVRLREGGAPCTPSSWRRMLFSSACIAHGTARDQASVWGTAGTPVSEQRAAHRKQADALSPPVWMLCR